MADDTESCCPSFDLRVGEFLIFASQGSEPSSTSNYEEMSEALACEGFEILEAHMNYRNHRIIEGSQAEIRRFPCVLSTR